MREVEQSAFRAREFTSDFCPRFRLLFSSLMDAITLTRQLVDIESISGNEAAVGNYLYGELCRVGYQTCRNSGGGRSL